MEEWRDVVGYEGLYKISNYGNAKSLNKMVLCRAGKMRMVKGKIITKRINPVNGYVQYCLCNSGAKEYLYAHRIVATAFISNPLNKTTVNHKDENKLNNIVDNLEWATQSENNAYNNLHERRVANTDIRKRTLKINYQTIATKNKKPIYQCDQQGMIIKKWDGTIDASRALGINNANIWGCMNGVHRIAGGFCWKYA